MQFTIPLYIETRKDGEAGPTRHHVRPLFFAGPTRADEDLSRAQQRVTGDLQQHLLQLGRDQRHEWLSAWSFCPDVEQHRLDLLLDLKRRTARGRFFFVAFRMLDRKLAFCPSLPKLWFEIGRGQTLAHRAAETLTHHFRKLERDANDEYDVRPEDHALDGTAWVTTIDLEIDVAQSFKDPARQLMALLGATDVADGATELRNCGRCLNWLYPAGLDRAYLRDRETAELERLLMGADRRPILLLGRRLSGKTAIVHEYVSQTTARRRSPFTAKKNVWHLSPQRLVSGMSYVGQWESRLLAILKEARKRDHVLYFDDLPGLLLAGQSRDSSLSMAQVLRPYLERREVRLLAEITPEAWRILRERDRGLADLFDVLPVGETDPERTARIVLAARRSLEQEFGCRFEIDSLPAVIEIERRYSSDAAFPGKAVRFLKDLALRERAQDVTRDAALDEFHRRSGITSKFLDPRQRLERCEIVTALQSEVVGQPEPVGAVADVLSIAKARLNDTGRPIGSLLFLGPTGVGKTQLAKAVARFLFGDANRLLRFDLNEYLNRGSAARLVGTFEQPDGLLTGAVRRQPFAVVLFDEIEKAHPEVLDLLLQVLGEGRLSDGLGRTVSFTNALIVMTSNLGVREASQRLGFVGDAPVGDFTWHKAAERFFRPEFFNRIDRIVPFQRLSREVIEQVARVLLKDMLLRDGLTRRRCLLSLEPHALDRAIEEGYSPTLGARALKRSLERTLIQPAARQLAALPAGTLTRLHLYPSPQGIAVDVQPLVDAEPPPNCVALAGNLPRERLLDGIHRFLGRIDRELAPLRPTGSVSAGSLSDQQRAYYSLQERCRRLREIARTVTEAAREASRPGARAELPGGLFRHARKVTTHRSDTPSSFWASLAKEEADVDLFHQSLRDLFQKGTTLLDSEAGQLSLLHEAALTQIELEVLRDGLPTRIGLCVRPFDETARPAALGQHQRYAAAFRPSCDENTIELGVEWIGFHKASSDTRRDALFELSGPAAMAFAHAEAGTHLNYSAEGQMRAVQVVPMPLQPEQSLAEAWDDIEATRAEWLNGLLTGEARIEEDPLRPGRVVRLHEAGGLALDMRTGDMTDGEPDAATWRRFLLGVLPLPEEFR